MTDMTDNISFLRTYMRTYAGGFFLFLLSHLSSLIFRSTSGRLQSKNVFPAKIQQTERSNLTFRSIHSFRSFRSIRSIRSISLSLHHDRMAIHDEYDIVHRNRFATFCVQRQNIFPN